MRRIELTVVVEGNVEPWRYPPSFDFQYGDWWRSEFESGKIEPWPTAVNPDVSVLIAMVLLRGQTAFGPPPAEVFDPIPHDDLIRAMVSGIGSLRDDLEDQIDLWADYVIGEIYALCEAFG